MTETLLPSEFSDLERFAAKWCLASEQERYMERLGSSMEEMQAFYDALFPRADQAMTYCDKFPLDDMPEDALNLLRLLFSLVMVSFPVEVWGQPRIPDSGAAYLDLLVEPAP
ncbi:MAG: hypothetical protein ACRDYB_06310 [Acidimicrobiales bacterium]